MRRSCHKQPGVRSNEKSEAPFFSNIHDPARQTSNTQPPFFQTKGLAIGQPGDKYEKEADAVADAMVSPPHVDTSIRKMGMESIQRISLATPRENERSGSAEQRIEEDKLVQEKPEIQKAGVPEEEEIQMQEIPGEEEEIQMLEEDEEVLQTKSGANQGAAGPELSQMIRRKSGSGRPLPGKTQAEMGAAFGQDFTDVNVHTDSEAVEMNKGLHAQAFTHGRDIYFNGGRFNPDTDKGKHLLAHELTHVIQQTGGVGNSNQVVQRWLLATGATDANVNEYLALVGGAAGFTLRWLAANPRVRITGNTAAGPTSQSARRNLRQVINDPVQHAEVFVGTHQPRVSIGAFPGAGSTVQNIDIDDIRNLNTALPGQGTAKAFHEMMENYHSHGAGGPGFGPSHQTGVEAESDVLEESGIAGRRLNSAGSTTNIPDFVAAMLGLPTGPNISYHANTQEFTHYFLVMIRRVTATAAGNDFEFVGAFRMPKIQVSQRTIDSYTTDSDAPPPAGNAVLAATLADLTANPNATLLIEGFTDNVGRADYNRGLSLRRARSAQAFFIANGINAARIAIAGRGETNFVSPNNTAAGRNSNRRIVMTVHRPAF